MVQAGCVTDVDLMLPGDFSAATRLSPKALRLYAEQGLLAPAHIDPTTGYRRYHRDQIPRGRLIGRLRTLNLPLARIATLSALSPEARQAELHAWLAAQQVQLQRRRELVEALDHQSRPVGGTPRLLARPQRKLLCRERRVHIGELDGFVAESQQRIRGRLRATGLPGDGPTLVHFHGCGRSCAPARRRQRGRRSPHRWRTRGSARRRLGDLACSPKRTAFGGAVRTCMDRVAVLDGRRDIFGGRLGPLTSRRTVVGTGPASSV